MPTGLAGVPITEILDEADATLLEVAIDDPRNPALVLAAAIAGTADGVRRDKLGLISDGAPHIVGLPDWIEQLVAESTGKEGTGILPVVLFCSRSRPRRTSSGPPPTCSSCASSTTPCTSA